jgi:hypothetical protein
VEAKRLIANASYGPEALRVLGQAFDEAWQELAPRCGQNELSVRATRLKLANAILSAAGSGSRDAEAIMRAALSVVKTDRAGTTDAESPAKGQRSLCAATSTRSD